MVRTETGAPFCLDVVEVSSPEYDQLVMVKIYYKNNSRIPRSSDPVDIHHTEEY
jgi:hypothetical protein